MYAHVARLHVLVIAWNKNKAKSYKLGKAIYALNLPQYEEDYFPRELQPLMESLMEILGDMGDIFEGKYSLYFSIAMLISLIGYLLWTQFQLELNICMAFR